MNIIKNIKWDVWYILLSLLCVFTFAISAGLYNWFDTGFVAEGSVYGLIVLMGVDTIIERVKTRKK